MVDWTKAAPKAAGNANAPRFFRYGDYPGGALLTFLEEPTDKGRSKLTDTVAEALVWAQPLGADGTAGEPKAEVLFSMNARTMGDFAEHGKAALLFKGTRWLLRKNPANGFWTAKVLLA